VPIVAAFRPWNTKFVSGPYSTFVRPAGASDFRKKYSTWAPGVSRPSGMIFVYSLVCPGRLPGNSVPAAGKPMQMQYAR